MTKLAETFKWAASTDIQLLRQAVRTAGLLPLRAIGSGGSLTVAHVLASIHQRYTGRVAAVATPLEASDNALDSTVSTWLLSAGGSNVDVMSSAKTLIAREPRQLAVLCGRETSPLVELCRQHTFVDLLIYQPPSGKDGFLATNSALAFSALLMRAYAIESGQIDDWNETSDCLQPLLADSNATIEAWQSTTSPLWRRPTTLVLHGSSTKVGAIDLESKFTEAALGSLQFADYRNFAHGRHHWLAKHAGTSALLAFITKADRELAERTLNLIPANIPRALIAFEGGPSATALASLLASLRITGWAGLSRGQNPGGPGVPEFGRKLYKLAPSPRRTIPGLRPWESAAISRKTGTPVERFSDMAELDHWRSSLSNFVTRLHNTEFAGVVLDYDGTMIDPRKRGQPPTAVITDELSRLIKSGIRIAIATGRGASVRNDLQECLPRDLWPLVLVGYYNGAEIATLDANDFPHRDEPFCAELEPLINIMKKHPDISRYAKQTFRPNQITLEAIRAMPGNWLWDTANQIILSSHISGVKVTRSVHSIDITPARVSKLNVVNRLREEIGDVPILAIGDQGRWPGNDHELLREPFALGVDEINSDPTTCWHLGKPGQRGPSVTFDYLSALEPKGKFSMFTEKP